MYSFATHKDGLQYIVVDLVYSHGGIEQSCFKQTISSKRLILLQ